MINNLEELYKNVSDEELVDLFVKCLSKNKSEIIEIFKENGYEISDDFASECLKCCEEVTLIDESDLAYVTGGGSENGCIPHSAKICLNLALKGLQKYKSGATEEFTKELAQGVIDDLTNLLAKPYNKEPFKKELTGIELRVAFLPRVRNNGKDIALRNIAEAQRITYYES